MSINTTTARRASGAPSAAAENEFYVFLRCWPGFTRRFPFTDFDNVPDADLRARLRSSIAAEQKRAKKMPPPTSVFKDVASYRAQAIMRPSFNPRWFSVRPTKPPEAAAQGNRAYAQSSEDDADTLIADAARALGWRVGRGLIRTMIDDTDQIDFSVPAFFVSRTVWLTIAPHHKVAAGLAKYLMDQPLNNKQRLLNHQLNRRFGYVRASELDDLDRMAILPALADLATSRPLDYWGEMARPWLESVQQYFSKNGIEHGSGEVQVMQRGRRPIAKQSKSWTQQEADIEISKYKANRAPQYYAMVNRIDALSGTRRKKTISEARKVFGRNVIAKATGIPAGMVSNSPEWATIKNALAFDESLGVKSHFGKAVEDASEAAGNQTEADVFRRETVRLVNERIGQHFTKEQATLLIEQLSRGECTDEQARQAIRTLDDNL